MNKYILSLIIIILLVLSSGLSYSQDSWFRRIILDSTYLTVGIDDHSVLGYRIQLSLGILNETDWRAKVLWRNYWEVLPWGKEIVGGYHVSWHSGLYYECNSSLIFGMGLGVGRTVNPFFQKTGFSGTLQVGQQFRGQYGAKYFVGYLFTRDTSTNPWNGHGVELLFEGQLPWRLLLITDVAYVHYINNRLPSINGLIGNISLGVKI